MISEDRCCTIAPYSKVHEGMMEEFKAGCDDFIAATKNEDKVMFYGFSFHGDQAHCREGYKDAEGILAHLDNVSALLQETLKIADLTRLEIHGPAEELAKLKAPLSPLNPVYFTLGYGFRKS